MSTKPHIHSDILHPWTAYISEAQSIPLDQAVGRVATSTIRQYPPGIPEIVPGMTYTEGAIQRLRSALAGGQDVIGMQDLAAQTVKVAKQNKSTTKSFSCTTMDSRNVPRSLAIEVADFFREQFCAAPYFHFAFHESDPLQALPKNLDYAAYAVSTALSDPEKRQICQDTLRDLALRKFPQSGTSSQTDNIILPNGFHHWTDKEICRAAIQDRLQDPGYVTLVRENASNTLVGLLHARCGSLKRLFESEEWSDPHHFSTHKDPRLLADSKAFFERVNYHFGLRPEDLVMTISAQILREEFQGGEAFYDMMRSMAECVTAEHVTLPLLCEIPPYGTAYTLNRAFTDRVIFGVLKNDHPLVFCKQTSQALFPFISDKGHWHAALKRAVRNKRQYQTKYYIPLPTDNPAVTVKPNGKLGLAVFATENIASGSRIAVFTGERYRSETALGLPAIMRDHAIQIGHNEYVFGYKGLAHRICHSCDPNCGIRNLTEIFAVRDIKEGEQICWDYRCSENSNWILDKCLCGHSRCTGVVGNYDSLPAKFRAEYLDKSMVSEWLR